MINRFIIALQFLTRLQVYPNIEVNEKKLGESMVYFPLVGLTMGGILAFFVYLSSHFFSPLIVSALLIALEVYLSGGLHLDGFMDTIDGLFSGRSKERALEIMRDSRVGANSVTALACLFLLKLSVLTDFPKEGLIPTLVLMPSLGRLTQIIGVVCFPYLRKEGMARSFNDYTGKKELLIAVVLSLIICLSTAKLAGLIFLGVTLILSWVLGSYVTSKLDGLTGDVYGAISEITEIVILLVSYLYFSP